MPPIAATSPPPSEKRLMTAEEFWDFVHLEENEDRSFELIRGEIVEVDEMPRPTIMHGIVMGQIYSILKSWAVRTKAGIVVPGDSGVVLKLEADSVVGPDVAFYNHIKNLADIPAKWSLVPPYLAVEILSPSDRPSKVNKKIFDYLTAGTSLIWLVDYEDLTISVFRPQRNLEILRVEDRILGGEELQGFECNVADLFSLAQPSAS